jgi:hypothetical protein
VQFLLDDRNDKQDKLAHIGGKGKQVRKKIAWSWRCCRCSILFGNLVKLGS